MNAQIWANMGHAYGALGNVEQEATCYRNAQRIRNVPPPQPDLDVIHWKSDWWNDIIPYTRRRLHDCKVKIYTWLGR